MRPVQARARQQLGLAAVQAGVHAISVVLDLMQPSRALRRRVHEFAKLWLNPLWKTGRMALWPIIP
jgi:peptide deformylase